MYPPIPPRGTTGIEGLRHQQPLPSQAPAGFDAAHHLYGAPAPSQEMNALYAQQPLEATLMTTLRDAEYNDANIHKQPTESVSGIGATLKKFFVFFLLVSVWMLQLWAQLAICKAIGASNAWMWSILWCFLGNFVVVMITAGLCTLTKSGNVSEFTMAFMVWTWVFCFSTLMPYAETASRLSSTERYLVADSIKNIHCWRNPSVPITASNTNYITLEESAWNIKYKQKWMQKVSTVSGTEEDSDASSRYNYCVAPIRYTGAAPNCTYNLYAVCYADSTGSAATSCSETVATQCGWTWPSNTVILRVLNQNGEFYSDMESADESQWRTAMNNAAVPYGLQPPVLVDYGNDGPDAMRGQQAKVQASLNTQKKCFQAIYGLTVLLYAIGMTTDLIETDAMRKAGRVGMKVCIYFMMALLIVGWILLESV